MYCENCQKEHNGSYASGRFCSKECAKGFSTKAKRKEINELVSKANKGQIPWHKGLKNVYSEETLKHHSATTKKYFEENPGEAIRRTLGHQVTEITKERLSAALKGKSGGIRKGGGRGKHGWYKGYWCDSSWELAWVIYQIDHNVEFERNKQGFTYSFENKTYKYYPDFIQNNQYIEIKGWLDEKNKAKHNQFPHSLCIITKNEIQKILEYVEIKYGKDFIKLYEK